MPSENEIISRILSCAETARQGNSITKEDARWLFSLPEEYAPLIQEGADTVREAHRGNLIDPCTVMNAKSGGCSEDCHFCAQSTHFRTIAPTYDILASGRWCRRSGKISAESFSPYPGRELRPEMTRIHKQGS